MSHIGYREIGYPLPKSAIKLISKLGLTEVPRDDYFPLRERLFVEPQGLKLKFLPKQSETDECFWILSNVPNRTVYLPEEGIKAVDSLGRSFKSLNKELKSVITIVGERL